MEVKNSLLKIQNAVQTLPLEEVLDTAESVAPLIPAAGTPLLYVIKVLKLLIKARPVANNLLGTSIKMTDSIADIKNANKNIDDENDAERAEMMDMLDQMIDIAADDGELTPEEEECLLDMVRDLGLNEKVVLTKVKMKCLQNK